MEYVGIQTQKSSNNFRSLLLLVLFPILVLGLVWIFMLVMQYISLQNSEYAEPQPLDMTAVTYSFVQVAPFVMGAVLLWFVIAYFSNSAIISNATGSRPLERRENKRVYNLVENLCMSQGMELPRIYVINDSSLNAFASGINRRSYAVTLTTGIIDKLDDQELEAVIAHELSHIRNHDVRLLIVSIVFVGIFTFVAQAGLRMLFYAPRRSSRNDKNGGALVMILVAVALAAVGYILASLMRFAISRNREYMADAGSAEMTKNPLALASALRKISGDPLVEAVTRDDVAQLFIEHPLRKKGGFGSLFATHPPIEKRIATLEQF